MKQEDKQLLLRDLCGRIPYYVKGKVYDEICTLNSITPCGRLSFVGINSPTIYEVHEFKPYLFPMSSMTEEQSKEYSELLMKNFYLIGMMEVPTEYEYLDWLNAHHFDYRGLIDKKLAIDATNLHVYDK